MSRLSRDRKRDRERAAHVPAPAVTPIDVRVPADGSGTASVGGVPVVAAPGEEVQHAVLNHLHRIALATGHPVLATVRDERIGYVVPLQVREDGSSGFTGEPVPLNTPEAPGRPGLPDGPGRPDVPGGPETTGVSETVSGPESPDVPEALGRPEAPGRPGEAGAPEAVGPAPEAGVPTPEAGVPAPETAQPPRTGGADPSDPSGPSGPSGPPVGDTPTQVLRHPPTPDAAPTFRMRTLPQPPAETPTFILRPLPGPGPDAPAEAPRDHAPGTVAPPTGAFGPPPVMDTPPTPASAPAPLPLPTPPAPAPAPEPSEPSEPAFTDPPEPDPKPTPPRGFDAVAEAVLGDEPPAGAGEDAAAFAEPVARINEAVKTGGIDTAAQLAERTLAEASGALGPDHPEVLRLGELTAYVAYLAGDPVRAFRLSLDLARARRGTGDAEAAYGNVQSAATAWRAVRDPEQGLRLGHDLIGLWSDLAAEEGPAAEDVEQLHSARARMDRLAARARAAGPRPTA
ncbi:tetratricopeptide repeat protein [Streptomyces echinoruber]|uniref:Tetratricopeptide repeat protein n=1 Tax=Streptomyces echinoruber TaxID=68898 RepID=A0A918VN62_9ACTN|nr:tetratricopeptide repeat protein [Streptomyces echinoruber]GHA14516.1 hypothetical protein GCM10010389_61570 [Streptomyces echinoruber]